MSVFRPATGSDLGIDVTLVLGVVVIASLSMRWFLPRRYQPHRGKVASINHPWLWSFGLAIVSLLLTWVFANLLLSLATLTGAQFQRIDVVAWLLSLLPCSTLLGLGLQDSTGRRIGFVRGFGLMLLIAVASSLWIVGVLFVFVVFFNGLGL